MTDPIHYLDPTPVAFKTIVVFNDKGMVRVELHDAAGAVVHTFAAPGTFDVHSTLRLSLGGKVTVSREL